MFESTNWCLEEPDIEDTTKFDLLVPTVVKPKETVWRSLEIPLEIGIIHQFQFSSTLQRMSVVTKILGSEHFTLFCKGSPEMIVSLSKRETIPENIIEQIEVYTEKGYRVIALGTRIINENFLKVQKMHREEVENDLVFLGLIVLENRLKPETYSIIKTLKSAEIKVIMITGKKPLDL